MRYERVAQALAAAQLSGFRKIASSPNQKIKIEIVFSTRKFA